MIGDWQKVRSGNRRDAIGEIAILRCTWSANNEIYRCMLLRTAKGIPNSFAHCVTLSTKSLESCLKS